MAKHKTAPPCHSSPDASPKMATGASPKMASSYKEEKESVLKGIIEKVSSSSSAVDPSGGCTAIEVAATTDDRSFSHDDESLVDGACRALQAARGLDPVVRGLMCVYHIRCRDLPVDPVDLSGVPLIDRYGMRKILWNFERPEDFSSWLTETVERNLAAKARTPGYGLWMKDARVRGPEIAAERRRREKQADEACIADDRKRAERAALLTTPQPPEEAIAVADRLLLDERGRRVKLHPIIAQRVRRVGRPIAPAELIKQNHEYRPCEKCRDQGVQGGKLQRTFRFCDCLAGVEQLHLEPDLPEREIARVHANLRNLLQEAAYEVKHYFEGDAIGAADVRDDGQTLTFTAESPIDAGYLKDSPAMRAILARVGLARDVAAVDRLLRSRKLSGS